MIVRSYRTCDICGKKLTTNEDLEKNYLIEPKSKLKMKVLGYIWKNPYDRFWSEGVDICKDCWKDMKKWIKENRRSNES
jgi:hypothetical protein